jgi:hypothetical protein
MKFVDWLVYVVIPFAATFSGVFLAFILATKRERQKRKEEQLATRRKTKEILTNELTQVKNNLDGAASLKSQYGENYVPNIDLPTDAKQSVVNSGAFSLLEMELQTDVSHIYTVIERAQIFLSQMIEFDMSIAMSMTTRDKIWNNKVNNFWGQVQHLQDYIPQLVQKLKKEDLPEGEAAESAEKLPPTQAQSDKTPELPQPRSNS